jgi:hypothetical protein
MRAANRLMNLLGYRMSRATPHSDLQEFLRSMRALALETPLIRVGGPADGGYLVPDLLEGIVACFSPGVANTCDFELEMANRGIVSFMADYSVDAPPLDNPLFRFEKKFLGTRNDDVHMRIDEWVNRCAGDMEGDLLLQMDIEGAEYPVILDAERSTLRRFRIIVLELHDFDQVFVDSAFRHYKQFMDKLLDDFVVVHLHPNNGTAPRSNGSIEVPKVLELTFLRRDHARMSQGRIPIYPHELDAPNISKNPDHVLPTSMR